jgi:hypothetical protein
MMQGTGIVKACLHVGQSIVVIAEVTVNTGLKSAHGSQGAYLEYIPVSRVTRCYTPRDQ